MMIIEPESAKDIQGYPLKYPALHSTTTHVMNLVTRV